MNRFPPLSRESHYCRGGVHSRYFTLWGKLAIAAFLLITAAALSCRAAAPSDDELQALLRNAEDAWGHEADGPVSISAVPMNSCVMSIGRVTPDVSIMEWSDVLLDGKSTGKSYSIRINSNCDWSKLPLATAVLHEYGHVVLGPGYHSRDRKSVMYPVIKARSGQDILAMDRKRLVLFGWLP